jgi:hypothetical protein
VLSPSSNKSLSFRVLAAVGFIVVCLGLFVPRLIGVGTSNPSADRPTPPPDVDLPTASSGPSLGWSLGKMLLGVGGVAVACIGLSRYLNRRSAPVVNPNLEVIASLPVDARSVIHLVRLDPTGVKAVTELIGSPVIGPVRVSASISPDGSTAGLVPPSSSGRGANGGGVGASFSPSPSHPRRVGS